MNPGDFHDAFLVHDSEVRCEVSPVVCSSLHASVLSVFMYQCMHTDACDCCFV